MQKQSQKTVENWAKMAAVQLGGCVQLCGC
jgi:hypothetical protein